ncbi:MAG: 6-phosphogluconolactonase [Tepidiformaceae bacterium]
MSAPRVRRELTVVTDVAAAAERHFLALRPRTVALSGGSTPKVLYQRLATASYPWAATELFFGDERCVPPDDPDSNFRMASEALLSKVPARVHRMHGEDCDAAGYAADIAATFGPGIPRFDLIFLGLGPDGHTASLFPGDAALDEAVKTVLRVERPDHSRLTLTLPVLCAAKVAMFLVVGEAKRTMLAQLMADGDIPAARVAAGRVMVIADEAAAGGPTAS